MFNKYLALGLPETEMLYASCGARKIFDDALIKILENVHYQGAVDMLLADEPWMEALKKLSPEYSAEVEQADTARENAADALDLNDPGYDEHIVRVYLEYNTRLKLVADRLTKEIFDREFVVTGSQYAGITVKHIEQMLDTIRADSQLPAGQLQRARAKLAELQSSIDRDNALLSQVRGASESVSAADLRTLETRVREADVQLNAATSSLMDSGTFWDMNDENTYPPAAATALRAYRNAQAAHQAARFRSPDVIRERIRANQAEISRLNGEIASLAMV